MTIDELWVLIRAKYHKQLTPLQKLVLYQAWEGHTYAQIAKQFHRRYVLRTRFAIARATRYGYATLRERGSGA